jgi:aerobic-type carbon monoxide dehydrogenase small subunit (CoxS/CutS family)
MSSSDGSGAGHRGRLLRALPRSGARLAITIDGRPVAAIAGDTILVAALASRGHLRIQEHDGTPRAGFCLMGACQDCWVWLADGRRVRACTTPAVDGLAILTRPPEGYPFHE